MELLMNFSKKLPHQENIEDAPSENDLLWVHSLEAQRVQ